MKETIKLGVVGLGQRGFYSGTEYPGMITILAKMEDVEIVSVCDEYPDRIEATQKYLKENHDLEVTGTTDYRELVSDPRIDAVAIFCAWEMHVPIAVAAMKAGKAVALEVGGGYSVEDCWRLVRTQEETGAYFMMLENCCYGREEMMVLNLVRQGRFGEIVHCAGGYFHDLRMEISRGDIDRHYRLRNYLLRNAENYPTHELGPIAKVLDINRGNRMMTLASFASKAVGVNVYNEKLHGPDHPLAKARFAQGDIVTTLIKCAGGETISLTLDTTLPRPYYSRGFTVRGTKGAYVDETKCVFFDNEGEEPDHSDVYRNNVQQYLESDGSPLWKEYDELGVDAGHGGIDWHVLRAFVESYKNDIEPPIDVYDAAAWMCISALSESSIARGGAVVDIPDFTGGKWVKVPEKTVWKYSL